MIQGCPHNVLTIIYMVNKSFTKSMLLSYTRVHVNMFMHGSFTCKHVHVHGSIHEHCILGTYMSMCFGYMQEHPFISLYGIFDTCYYHIRLFNTPQTHSTKTQTRNMYHQSSLALSIAIFTHIPSTLNT